MAGKKGMRLSPQIKKAIAAAGPDVTNTALAEKYKTSMQTVARWRTGTPTTASKKEKTATTDFSDPGIKRGPGGIEMKVDGDYIVLRFPKKGLLKGLIGELLA